MSTTTVSPFGVIYPLPANLASRILQNRKSVFVKYPTHEIISPKLASCKKLVLYISHSNKEIAGVADIISINLMSPAEVVAKYCGSLFLTLEELRAYSKGRENKRMIVLVLDKIKRYQEPKHWMHGMTMAGEYISKEQYDSLIGESD